MRRDFAINKKFVSLVAVIIIGGLIIFGIYKLISGGSSDNKSTVEQIEVAPAKAKIDLNKDFSFPLLNDKGDEISQLKYTIESAELQDEIVVKGQKATSIKGKTFLIVNLKVTNSYNKAITISTRDYVRLVINNNDQELLAPEIHNDPVEVLAISTKYTRVGFTISDTDKDLRLKVGEISKDKTDVPLSFSN